MREVLATTALVAGVLSIAAAAWAENAPGVSDSEIKIGQTMSYSGPASAYGVIGRTETAYFKMIDEQGGLNGRAINLISLDDAYSPIKIVEQTRKLVEEDNVAFLFGALGTPTNIAVQRYLNDKKIPQLLIGSGAYMWGDYQRHPWTMAMLPVYRVEAQIYAKYLSKEKPGAKVGVLYQNDDFGKDYVRGLKDVLGDKYAKVVVKEVTYEVSDPTVGSQIIQLQASGADVLLTAATAKPTAQAIRKVAELGWKPLHLVSSVSTSIGAVFKPAGLDNSIGVVSATPYKDATDPRWKDDPQIKQWFAFMKKYMPGADTTDINYLFGYSAAQAMVQILRQCGNDLSRENIMKQATNLNKVEIAILLPGITLNTSPMNYRPITQAQLQRFDGKHMVPFGEIISANGS